MKSSKSWFCLAAWCVAVALSCLLDARLAQFSRDSGIEDYLLSRHYLREMLKAPGEYWFVLICAALVYLAYRPDWRPAAFVVLAPMVSCVNGLLKWIVGRHRPFRWYDEKVDALWPFQFEWFRGGLLGILKGTNLSFPSGHVSLAFATATALAILWPRYRWAFYALAGIVAVERVLENAHWLSDCVAAAAIGIGGIRIIHWCLTGLHDAKALSVSRNTCV